jgi:WD40 repeat protein
MSKTIRNALALILIFSLSAFFVAAAQTAPIITNNTEYDIGTGCPEAQTLSPDGKTLWVLLSDCAYISGGGVALTAYSAEDGALAAEPIPVYFHDATQASYIDHFTNPLGLTVDGHFSIRYNDSETYAPQSTTIVADGSDAPASVIDDAALAELLLSVSDYPEGAIYSHDHTRVAITGDTAMTVFDLLTGDTLFSLPVEEETYNAYPSFSPDGETLYVAALDDYEDMESYAATVTSYDLTDGSVTGSFAAPSFIVWVSPDGKYAAVETGSNDGTVSELVVVDTETDAVSEPFSLYEPPRRVTACTNDGRSMSDVDFTASGTLALIGVNWLPDSSGFVITRSYGGEGAFGGSICTFDTSRLNVIRVGGE